MEYANRDWIKKPVDLYNALAGIKTNHNELLEEFRRISMESAISGEIRKNQRKLEDIALVSKVLGELESAFKV